MEVRRYCGHCLNEVQPGESHCPGCHHPLPTTARSASRAGADSLSESYFSRGETALAAAPFGALPPSVLEETVVRPPLRNPVYDDGPSGWQIGQLISERFRILRCIGQGGMGKVYLARDESLDRLMALKRVPQEIVIDGDARDELREETNRLLDLAHENIIRVHTYYDEPTWPFFAMEYLEGPTLKGLLRERRRDANFFSVEELTIIARQVGKGLSYAHSKKLIHRDLKPANIMLAKPVVKEVDNTVIVKITDFGISRVVADSTLRQTGRRSGTVPYMSPEQFRGEECTERSDVYSLGVTYYELLAGRPPFYTGEIGHQILNEEPRPIDGLSGELNEVLLRALAKNPKDRYRDASEFTNALERRQAYPSYIPVVPWIWNRAKRSLKVAAALLFVALFLFLAVDYLRRNADSERDVHPLVSINSVVRTTDVDADQLQHSLQAQIDEAIPDRINSTTLVFRLKRTGAFQRSLSILHSVFFVLEKRGEDRIWDVNGKVVRDENGDEDSDVLEFTAKGLGEGQYTLRPFLLDKVTTRYDLPENLSVQKKFTVDMTGPDFVIKPIHANKFARVSRERLAIFADSCLLRLTCPENAGDIEEAHFYSSDEDQSSDRTAIADTGLWKVQLSRRQNFFRVVARDVVGNSEEQILRIDRLDRSVPDLRVDPEEGVQGNIVEIRGRLHVSTGYEPPPLVFFVNGRMVRDPGDDFVPPDSVSNSFRARLPLPRVSNTIEVRYQLGDDFVFFDPPSRVSNVRVSAPKIATELPERTGETRVTFRGTLSPFFEGLVLSLDHSSVSQYRLSPTPDTTFGGRRFDHEIELAPDTMNELILTCRYNGEPLELDPASATFFVYCDRKFPELPDGIQFEGAGLYVRARLEPSEELSGMRIRMAGEADWHRLKNEAGVYKYSTPAPTRETTFEVQMIDLVGNSRTISEVCRYYVPDDRDELLESKRDLKGVGRTIPGLATGRTGLTSAAGRVGDTNGSCDLLRRLGIDFRLVGRGLRGSVEISTTEITRAVWNRFLIQRGADPLEGDPGLPVSVGENFDRQRVRAFLRWLELGCDGRYDFFLPSPDEWRTAFTGESDADKAGFKIRVWFHGFDGAGFQDVGVGSRRYGQSKISPVGSRPENQTSTGLFDMESNLREIVVESDRWYVIGGYNRIHSTDLSEACTRAQRIETALQEHEGRYIGLRIARRKK